jgi:hypothetical protein
MATKPVVQDRLKRAAELKENLEKFVTDGNLKEDYEEQKKLFSEFADMVEGEHESHSFLDWFLYEWADEYGEGVIEQYVDSHEDLSAEDEEMMLDWIDSVHSIFEVKSIKENTISLKDLDSNERYMVVTSDNTSEKPFSKGQFISARILPLGEKFIFAGVQFVLPDRKAAMEAIEMRRALEEMEDEDESMMEAQQQQREAFIELFGKDEVSIAARQLPSTIGRFQRYLFFERKDPETGMTAAQVFADEFGEELKLPELPVVPNELAAAGEITLLCDEFEGILILPEYQQFKRVFASPNPDEEVPDWRDLVWNYVEEPSIPIVAFERVAETHPQEVEKVMRVVLDDADFSIEHLYAALLHYKEPAEGFENMADEERLWDLFDGNGVKENGNVVDFTNKNPKKKS